MAVAEGEGVILYFLLFSNYSVRFHNFLHHSNTSFAS